VRRVAATGSVPPSAGAAGRTANVSGGTRARIAGAAGPGARRCTNGPRGSAWRRHARGRSVHWLSVFDALSEKLQETLADVRAHGTLTEDDINKAMREIRLALLEADVNFKVVKQFTATVKERCLGADVVGQLNPGQQVVKIVHEELAALMGGASMGITFSPRPPTVVLMAGLQGSGKTTAAAKLARHLKTEHGSSVALAACDVYRPAAVDQLVKVGGQVGADVYERGTDVNPVEIARWALDRAKTEGKDVLIVDTAGRLHVDAALMDELVEIRKAVRPHAILLVVDAMTGQDAVNVAEQFAEAVDFDGVLMTKLDGDARGGAALSAKAVTGKPILFASVGEKLDQLERFHPERMAQRILGMGDVMSLIEKAERQFEEDEAKELERKLRRNEFTLEDFLKQLKTLRKMGPLQSILGMLPGLSGQQLSQMKVDEREIDRVEAIILSMTPEERRRPELIKGSRRLRIAKGSGTSVQQVNQLVKQFDQMRKLMRQIGRGKMPDLGALMRQAR
jgi:signal recognition particle subunit SRP54